MRSTALCEPRFSVVIPTLDTRELTLRCVESLRASDSDRVEVILVDDGSTDDTAEAMRDRFPAVRILRSERPQGFTASVNRGLAQARGEILVLLNSDTEVDAGAWDALDRAFGTSQDLGVAGARLRYPDGRPQWSGGADPGLLWLFGLASGLPALIARIPGARSMRPVRGTAGDAVDWVTGAAMALRRDVLEQIGSLDESYHFYCQDLDFCARARGAGWAVVVAPDFGVVHHHGATVGRRSGAAGRQNPELLWRDLVRWGAKHRGFSWARRAAWALGLGGRLRLVGRWLGAAFRRGEARRAWRRDSLAYRRALESVREELRRAKAGTRPSDGGAPEARSSAVSDTKRP